MRFYFSGGPTGSAGRVRSIIPINVKDGIRLNEIVADKRLRTINYSLNGW